MSSCESFTWQNPNQHLLLMLAQSMRYIAIEPSKRLLRIACKPVSFPRTLRMLGKSFSWWYLRLLSPPLERGQGSWEAWLFMASYNTLTPLLASKCNSVWDSILSSALPRLSLSWWPTAVLQQLWQLFNLAQLHAKSKACTSVWLTLHRWCTLAVHTEADLQAMCTAFGVACNKFGMKINLKKMVVMTQPGLLAPSISIHYTPFSSVEQFTYSNNLHSWLQPSLADLVTEFGRISICHCNWRHTSSMPVPSVLSCAPVNHGSHIGGKNIQFLVSEIYSWHDMERLGAEHNSAVSIHLYTLFHVRHLHWAGHVYHMEDSRLLKAIL